MSTYTKMSMGGRVRGDFVLHSIEFPPSGNEFFPLREVPILKRDANEEDHCLTQ